MNRFDLVFSPKQAVKSPAPREFRIELSAVPVEDLFSADTGAPLMTRTVKPGTSVRRLRNHRSAWPRRA